MHLVIIAFSITCLRLFQATTAVARRAIRVATATGGRLLTSIAATCTVWASVRLTCTRATAAVAAMDDLCDAWWVSSRFSPEPQRNNAAQFLKSQREQEQAGAEKPYEKNVCWETETGFATIVNQCVALFGFYVNFMVLPKFYEVSKSEQNYRDLHFYPWFFPFKRV